MNEPSDSEQAELKFACDYCAAPVGAWCRVMGEDGPGLFARFLHVNRWMQANTVVHLTGWVQMEEENRVRLYVLRRGIRELRDANRGHGVLVDALNELLAV